MLLTPGALHLFPYPKETPVRHNKSAIVGVLVGIGLSIWRLKRGYF